MIFVTVGTHEQPFNRLIQKIDASNKELGYGALWALGGIALTAITDGAFIFYGAVLWGGWLIIKGIYHKIG